MTRYKSQINKYIIYHIASYQDKPHPVVKDVTPYHAGNLQMVNNQPTISSLPISSKTIMSFTSFTCLNLWDQIFQTPFDFCVHQRSPCFFTFVQSVCKAAQVDTNQKKESLKPMNVIQGLFKYWKTNTLLWSIYKEPVPVNWDGYRTRD